MSRAERVRGDRWRRRWLFVAGGSLALLVAGKLALGSLIGFRRALDWALVACPILVYVAWFYHTRRPRGGGMATVGFANAVTMVRGWLFAGVGGFVVLPPAAAIAWLPGLCYGTGALFDYVDGSLARATGNESAFGEKLDMAVDTLGFVVAPAVAVAWGRLPVWYLLLAGARYLFKLGRGYRRWRGLAVHELDPSDLRRNLSGLQMAFLTVALLPLVPPDPLAVAAAVVLTPSLAMFVRDYLVVAGRWPRTER